MKITRLHIILVILILALGGLCAYQYDQDRKRAAELAELKARQAMMESAAARKAEEDSQKRAVWAKQAVAVAGEYWLAAKQSGRDVSKGQGTLKLAKDTLAQKDYDNAVSIAFESIQELKNAPFLDVKYQVKYGDCLWNIAKMPEHYGKGAEWVRIWKFNRKKILDFDLIHPKQILVIPKANIEAQKLLPSA